MTDCPRFSAAANQEKSKKRKIRIKKVVHYIPESVVQYVPESIVHFIPEYSDNPTFPQSSEYFSKYHLGGNLAGGFRINSPNKRTAINILPINIHFGNQLTELHAKIEIDIKL